MHKLVFCNICSFVSRIAEHAGTMLTLFTAGPRITTVPRHCGGSECGKWSSGAADCANCADCAYLGILISGQHLVDVRCLVSEYSVSRSPHSLQILCSCLQSDRCLLSLHPQPPPPAVSGSPAGSHKAPGQGQEGVSWKHCVE